MDYPGNFSIENTKRKMLMKYPFFGSAVANLGLKKVRGIGTAGTDGKTIYYDPEFMGELTEDEQLFILAHQVCHIIFNHILRSDGKNPRVWNTATDAVINQFLKKDGLPIARGGVDIEEAIHYDAESLYEKILGIDIERTPQNQKQRKLREKAERDTNLQSGLEGSDDGLGMSHNVGHDTHRLWEEAVKRYKEGKDFDGDERLKQIQAKMAEMGEKEAFKKNKQTKKAGLEELLETLSRETLKVGTTTHSEIRKTQNIGTGKPLIDWRLWLREAMSTNADWSYANAEIEDGVVRPNLETYPVPETEILLDTSGSIDENLLKNFLRECKNIVQKSRVKVGCFDTEFYGWNEVKTIEDIDTITYVGGGGTDFNAAVNAFTKRVENKIIFTDGEAPMPDRTVYAIWVVLGRRTIKPKGGRVIHISEEQLRTLCPETVGVHPVRTDSKGQKSEADQF